MGSSAMMLADVPDADKEVLGHATALGENFQPDSRPQQKCHCLTKDELPHARATSDRYGPNSLLLPARIFPSFADTDPPDVTLQVNGEPMQFYSRPEDSFTYCKAWDAETHP